ncbi:hypothetical protein BC834DRAFT_95710 [Gloeopeniophorella convolvens]|nr:hypothetical protein BC834DRAFT_95710 [Gloeopeniophorella convolvens]
MQSQAAKTLSKCGAPRLIVRRFREKMRCEDGETWPTECPMSGRRNKRRQPHIIRVFGCEGPDPGPPRATRSTLLCVIIRSIPFRLSRPSLQLPCQLRPSSPHALFPFLCHPLGPSALLRAIMNRCPRLIRHALSPTKPHANFPTYPAHLHSSTSPEPRPMLSTSRQPAGVHSPRSRALPRPCTSVRSTACMRRHAPGPDPLLFRLSPPRRTAIHRRAEIQTFRSPGPRSAIPSRRPPRTVPDPFDPWRSLSARARSVHCLLRAPDREPRRRGVLDGDLGTLARPYTYSIGVCTYPPNSYRRIPKS